MRSFQLVEKIDNCSRSELLKSVFCLSSAEAKNTSNRTSVRIVGIADNECAQCGPFFCCNHLISSITLLYAGRIILPMPTSSSMR